MKPKYKVIFKPETDTAIELFSLLLLFFRAINITLSLPFFVFVFFQHKALNLLF